MPEPLPPGEYEPRGWVGKKLSDGEPCPTCGHKTPTFEVIEVRVDGKHLDEVVVEGQRHRRDGLS